MRILFITEYFPVSDDVEVHGGVEARAYFVARGLAKRHDVTVICSREKGLPRESHFSNIKIIRCGREREYSQAGSVLGRISFIIDAYRTAKGLDCDVIDSQIFIPHLAALFLNRKKCVITYHSVWLGRWIEHVGFIRGILWEVLERLILRHRWAGIISVSEATKKELVLHGVPEDKITVIRNGVDLDEIKAVRAGEREDRICCVSRLVNYKKVECLLRAMKRVHREFPGMRCIIIGTGPEEKRLKALAAELEISESIVFVPFIASRKALLKEMKGSSLFCLPSSFEGFGMSLMESCACGIPYVCSDADSLREVTCGGEGGLLSRQGDPGDLARKMLTLLEDEGLYRQKSKEALSLVKKYKWEEIIPEIEGVYRKVCGG